MVHSLRARTFLALSLGSVHTLGASLPEKSLSRFALITSSMAHTPCLRETYYGAYGGQSSEHIYLPSSECLDALESLISMEEGSIVALDLDEHDLSRDGQLTWIGEAGVRDTTFDVVADWNDIQHAIDVFISDGSKAFDTEDQIVFGQSHHIMRTTEATRVQLIHMGPRSLLIHVPSVMLSVIDTLLPSHLVPVALPNRPLPRSLASNAQDETDKWGVPTRLAKHLENITSNLTFDPHLDAILNTISLDTVRRHVRWLTGEAPSGIETRHSFTIGAVRAAHYIKSASS